MKSEPKHARTLKSLNRDCEKLAKLDGRNAFRIRLKFACGRNVNMWTSGGKMFCCSSYIHANCFQQHEPTYMLCLGSCCSFWPTRNRKSYRERGNAAQNDIKSIGRETEMLSRSTKTTRSLDMIYINNEITGYNAIKTVTMAWKIGILKSIVYL